LIPAPGTIKIQEVTWQIWPTYACKKRTLSRSSPPSVPCFLENTVRVDVVHALSQSASTSHPQRPAHAPAGLANDEYGVPITDHNISMAGTTPKACSCRKCGNPRRKFRGKNRLTLQDRKALLPEE
jgi:hypothetical protein